MAQQYFIITGALYGMLSVIFGAFGAHALKKIISDSDLLKSFETGVKYQMYHAIVLLVLGLNHFNNASIYWCFTIGVMLFSFSIYGLVLSSAKDKKLKFLGPITPLGGLLLILGWLFILLEVI
ncbi:DUF423 domain-containing protein [Aestuariibaculum suncheonense]|uniref:DUF423 domain-containing protein n=1 Tax=Aestuariibaculum suncheonense TaxID=1028745 RepID=A0A8J6UIA9_9FLAO|nr:DUF423 domain-containing protein [Aestuariibaculum suncheonense]MBD0836399.1 DUF423 domain-containing protein [Aestuariibaculum suncheonense]